MNSLLEFLKKYSDVDIPFIKDFVAMQEGDKTHAPFKIDLEIVAKWLKSSKAHLKETLNKSYKKDIDYIILTPNRKRDIHGGQNLEIILLTEDCFKMMCMGSRAKESTKIKYYYVTLEKLLLIYMDDVIKNQQKNIDKLTRNLTTNKFPIKGAIYVIAIDNGYKFGKTNNMNNRYKLYKNAHKDNPGIVYIFYTHDIDRVEKCVNTILMYEEYRDRKEFYILELVDIITAIKDCDNQMNKFKCGSCKKTNTTIGGFKEHILKHHNKNEMVRFHGIGKKTE